jgi:metal-responsive CopG/Arc/MetJ family transcriptional regulator
MKIKRKRTPDATVAPSVRASISFPTEIYRTLEKIAAQKKVSLAWVVREAAEEYIAGKWPLFAKQQ